MFSIVVAFDPNQVIGKEGMMPWHYPQDLLYFKHLTLGKKVVMGSKTFQSILSYLHKPLPNRESIVLTSKQNLYSGIETFQSLQTFLKQYQDSEEEIFVIGGRSIYEQFLPFVTRLYITHIQKNYEGDTYFPVYDRHQFQLIHEKVDNELTFSVYERKV